VEVEMGVISGKILKHNGWPEGPIIRLAKDAADALWNTGLDRDQILEKLEAVRATPSAYLSDEALGALAQGLEKLAARPTQRDEALRDKPVDYRIWGRDYIDPGALTQMDNAMRLPVSVAGALMPDAHVGYGLPIGGVLATEKAVIPYAVGVDIACRMRLSVYDVSPIVLGQKPGQFEKALLSQTRFGMGAKWERGQHPEHPVLDDEAWDALPILRHLKDTAHNQLGTSGTGNHFVEWGVFELTQPDERLGLEPGQYLALLSHSGSRGVGFKIAEMYSRLAMDLHPDLDKAVRHLAWLDLDSEPGQEYWTAMNLAGRFASANHYVIHHRVAAAAGLKEAASVENHHNFCIPGDAIVPTPGGPKRMRELCAGDQVYAFDSACGLVETTVMQQWQTGVKRTRTIYTSNRKLTATDDHPVLTIQVEMSDRVTQGRKSRSGRLYWRKTSDICVGDIIVCAEGYYDTGHSVGMDRARLAGAFLGDGWVRHDTSHGRYTVGLAIGSKANAHTLQYLALLERALPTANWSINAPGAYGLTCMSAKVWRMIDMLGLAEYGHAKRVPNWVFRLSRPEKIAFLSGYVDADGSVANSNTSNHGRATIASTNRLLVEELREVALGCGLRITPVRQEIVRSNFGATTAYRCVISADSTNQLDLWHETKSVNRRSTLYGKPQGLIQKALGDIQLPANIFAQRVVAIKMSEIEQPIYDLSVKHADHSFVVEGVIVHNCWRERMPDGREVMVHRKGATPAGPGVLGVIPGSMGDAGYVVRGRGVGDSINSAAHGAGRQLSRKAAIQSITRHARDTYLRERGVTLLGGGLDESPQAYKPIESIIAAQSDLVDVIGKFTPKIVRMADEPGDW
jgi:tRNA-splicing ligase RtcB